MKIIDINKQKSLAAKLNESTMLTEQENAYLTRWQTELLPMLNEWKASLNEAKLSSDQVKALFGDIEDNTKDQKTAIGTAADLTGKAFKLPGKALDKIGELLKDTAPVKFFDQKFRDLKVDLRAKMGGDSSKIVKYLEGYADLVERNPKWQAGIIGILTIAASIAGGPAGGAAVRGLLIAADNLLKGSDLSTAVGAGFKSSILGAISGAIANGIGEWLSGLRADAVPFKDGLTQMSFNGQSRIVAPGFEWTRNFDLVNVTVLPDDVETVKRLVKEVNSGSPTAFDVLYKLAEDVSSDGYYKKLKAVTKAAKEIAVQNDSFFKAMEIARKGITAAVQASGAVRDAGGGKAKPLPESTSVQLTEIDLKGLAGGIAKWAKSKATQATQKFTIEKMMNAWEEAGSSTESDHIHELLLKMGVPEPVLAQVFKTQGIPLPVPGKEKPKTGDSGDTTEIKTGDPKLDAKINKIIRTKGKDAAIKYLKDLKAQRAAAANDPYEKFKGELRKLAGIPGKKELPADKAPKFKAELASDLKKMALGDKDSGAYAANKIMQYAKAGYNVSDQINSWLAKAKAGEKGPAPSTPISASDKAKSDAYELGKASRGLAEHGFLSAADYRDITAMLKEHGFDWRDLGISVILDETIRSGVFVSRMAA